MYLIEDIGEVALYRNNSDAIILKYGDKAFNLAKYGILWDYNTEVEGLGWHAISADIFDDPLSENDGNILLIWKRGSNGLWQSLSFSNEDGLLLGMYGTTGYFYSTEEMRSVTPDTPESAALQSDITFGEDRSITPTGAWVTTSTEEHETWEKNQIGVLFPDIYYGVAKESFRTYEQSQTYELGGIKDFDGTPHANPEPISDLAKQSYKYQGMVDVNKNGESEAIFTNKITGRWATASINSSGEIDYTDYGKGGTTRIVGIYIDPLVTSGDVVQFSDHDSQYRFQNDLKNDNLLVKTSGDYDSDGVQEVYWKTADGSAYLRSLMHADGNIRYANYQSEEQMSNYLTNNGYESVISDII
jgi:hypothetical protein